MPTKPVAGQQLALSTSWALLSRLAGIALGAVATGVLARSLDAGAFGAFLFALTVVGLVGALSDFGVSTIALRELAARPHDAPGIAAGIVIYRSVVTLAVAPLGAAAGLLAEAGPDRATFFIVYLVVIPGPLLGLQIVPQAQARGWRARHRSSSPWCGRDLPYSPRHAGGTRFTSHGCSPART